MRTIQILIVSIFLNFLTTSASENQTILSRRRRFLVFPEGSSLQVVFDLTYPAQALEGNLITFGNTATIGWELPSTPIFLDEKFKKKEKTVETTTVEIVHDHHDEIYQPELSSDYSRWSTGNHRNYHEAQSSVRFYPYNGKKYNGQIRNYYHQMGPSNFWRQMYYPGYLSYSSQQQTGKRFKRTVAQHIQRRSRREVFKRVEKLLSSLSKDGKSCVLKTICQVKKLLSKKGTFWEEIVKAIFRSKFDLNPDEDHYDQAFNENHDCEQMYPTCKGHVMSKLFRNKLKK
ncbi:uncharacterized protein [Euwallacea fornicatus]|uniref:uncharacterized protein n=1 Tax=Euwallacea fornicatus TaxID=995702 RepID=UPI0033902D76